MIKVFSFTRRMPGATLAEFERYWRDVHIPMWADIEGIAGYCVSRPATVAAGAEPPFDGIVELWYADEATMAASAGSPAGLAWRADSALFIGGMRSFLTRESMPKPRSLLGLGARNPKSLRLSMRPEDHSEADGAHGTVVSTVIRELKRKDIPLLELRADPVAFVTQYGGHASDPRAIALVEDVLKLPPDARYDGGPE